MQFNLALIDLKRCLAWGVDLPPCQAACPLGIDVEGYVTAISEGKFEKALKIIREKCPLPSVCGRVCHHPCEIDCKRSKVDKALAIRGLKRFIADWEYSQKNRPEAINKTKPQNVAIIGSGPAGLTAANDLANKGYGVTIYEAMPIAGGMLAFGIPEFDLPQEAVQREIDYIRSLGVKIITDTHIGNFQDIANVFAQGYQAVLIAVGAQGSQTLPIPGADLEGVIYALPFLKSTKTGKGISLKGKGVIIGGGNVAIDAARTALRSGAEKVDLICIESRETMPAFEWMVKIAEEEGVRIHPAEAPQAFRSKNGKQISQLDLKRVAHSERDSRGRISWKLEEDPKASSSLDVDWVIIAIGQKTDFIKINEVNKLEITMSGTLVVDSNCWNTNVEGIYAAGDIVATPGTVVEAMAAGRKAAFSIDCFLQGRDSKCEPLSPKKSLFSGGDILPERIQLRNRQEMPLIPVRERLHKFKEVEMGFSKEQVIEEAKRCLKCKTCNRCFEETRCVAFFLTDNRGKKAPMVKGNICEGCGRCSGSCPYQNIYVTEMLG